MQAAGEMTRQVLKVVEGQLDTVVKAEKFASCWRRPPASSTTTNPWISPRGPRPREPAPIPAGNRRRGRLERIGSSSPTSPDKIGRPSRDRTRGDGHRRGGGGGPRAGHVPFEPEVTLATHADEGGRPHCQRARPRGLVRLPPGRRTRTTPSPVPWSCSTPRCAPRQGSRRFRALARRSRLGKGVSIAPFAVVEEGAVPGDRIRAAGRGVR